MKNFVFQPVSEQDLKQKSKSQKCSKIKSLSSKQGLASAACKYLSVMPNMKPWNAPKVVS